MSLTPQKSFLPKQQTASSGASGTFDNPSVITVENGLVTSVTAGTNNNPFNNTSTNISNGVTVVGQSGSYSGIAVLRFLAGIVTNPFSGEADFQFPPASGDAVGTYPSLTVVALQGVSWQSGTPSDAQIPIYSTSALSWQHKGITGDGALTDTGAWTTIGLQGNPVAVTSPNDGDLLEFVSGTWTPSPSAAAGSKVYFGVATVTAITPVTLTGNPTKDGVGTAAGSVINCVNQAGTVSPPYAAHVNNGPWEVMGTGVTPMQRPSWFAAGKGLTYGGLIFTDQGTSTTGQLQTSWELVTGSGAIVGTTALAWSQVLVSLQNGVVGNLPVTNLNSGTGATSTTAWFGDGTWKVAGGGSLPTDYISGCLLSWVSTTQFSTGSGSAYSPNGSAVITVASPFTVTPTISASTLYYVYLASASTVIVSATPPSSNYQGTAWGDGSGNRYIGEFLTDASSHIYNFKCVGNEVRYRTNTRVAPFIALPGGTATSSASVSCSGIVPSTAFSLIAVVDFTGTYNASFGTSDGVTPGSSTGDLILGGVTTGAGSAYWAVLNLNASQAFLYCLSANTSTSVFAIGYRRDR